MRNKIFFLFTFVAFFSLHVKGEDIDFVIIAVSKDTTITVHDYLNDRNKHLYGDVDEGGEYGGIKDDRKNFNADYQAYVSKTTISGVKTQDSIGKPILLIITHEELEKYSILKFPYAINNGTTEKPNWYPDKKSFSIYICKKEETGVESASPNEEGSDSGAGKGGAASSNVKDVSSPVMPIILVLLFTLFVLSTILLYKILVISRRLGTIYEKLDSANVQAKDNSSPKNESLNEKYIESLRKDILNQISAETNTLKNIIDTQSQVLSRQIMDMRSQLDFESSNTNIELPLLQQKEFETTDVKYNFEDNTFTLGKNEMNFFKIYARNENYFYTLIDDESMRKEFLKIIASYKECIEICDQSAFPKQVEPFEEGRLIREGERFIISKVLKVKLV